MDLHEHTNCPGEIDKIDGPGRQLVGRQAKVYQFLCDEFLCSMRRYGHHVLLASVYFKKVRLHVCLPAVPCGPQGGIMTNAEEKELLRMVRDIHHHLGLDGCATLSMNELNTKAQVSVLRWKEKRAKKAA
jgi:hypothetical protein